MKGRIVIFGAGKFGKLALEHYGSEAVVCFVDNDSTKVGKEHCGKKIIAFHDFLKAKQDYRVVIAVNSYESVVEQFRECHIPIFSIFSPDFCKSLENMKGLYGTLQGRVILFGIDGFTRFLLNEMYQHGMKSEQVILAEMENHTLIGEKYERHKISWIGDVVGLADTIVISAKDRNFALQVCAENQGRNMRVVNPFYRKRQCDTDEILENPYDSIWNADGTEEEWNRVTRKSRIIPAINECAQVLARYRPLFDSVEIETVNRCNGTCTFCPVSVGHDIREKKVMERDMFQNIIAQLARLEYVGSLALFSNNEPFLDKRIIEFSRYARERLPKAWIYLYTNGTLLSLDKFTGIIKHLDEMVIDNYDQDLKLHPNCAAIKAYCEEHPDLKKKVTIVLRKPNQILTSRGGSAPNRQSMPTYLNDSCILPFRQMIIRPDGKVSLCCNDPYGRNTLGDLTKQTIMEVWEGKEACGIRAKLLDGRKNVEHCLHCDTFQI